VTCIYSISVGSSQYHLAVAGGCGACLDGSVELRTHPLPRGGTDCFQVGWCGVASV